jgi:hypothetical protein
VDQGLEHRALPGNSVHVELMTGFPIVDRELKVRCRSGRTHFWRIVLTAAGAVLVLALLQAGSVAGRHPVAMGETLFECLSWLGIAYALLAGPVLTADCLSQEKRQGTLPLLLLSPLPPSNIVFGKLLACALPALYALFGFLPLLALSFFLGGISLGEFGRTALLLVTLLVLSLAASGAVSAVMWSGRRALATVAAGMLVWVGLPWLWALTGATLPLAAWFPDPTSTWLAVLDENYGLARAPFIQRIVAGWGLATVCLVVAVRAVPRWLDPPLRREPASAARWFRHSPTGRHSRTRERWYALNPVAWLARQRSPLHWPLVVFALAFGLTAAVAITFEDALMLSSRQWIALVFCLHGLLKLWLAWELSRCLSRDQTEGLLEPLLAAPLTEHQIVHGWVTGLQTVFRGPVLLLIGMDLVLWAAGDLGRWRYPLLAMMGMVVFDAFALLWAGLYFGLVARTATRGLLQTIFAVLMAPWILGLLVVAALAATRIEWLLPQSLFVLCLGWIGAGLLVDAALCLYCSRRLGGDFRHLVAEKT